MSENEKTDDCNESKLNDLLCDGCTFAFYENGVFSDCDGDKTAKEHPEKCERRIEREFKEPEHVECRGSGSVYYEER